MKTKDIKVAERKKGIGKVIAISSGVILSSIAIAAGFAFVNSEERGIKKPLGLEDESLDDE